MSHLIIIWVFVFVPLYVYDGFFSHLMVCRISRQLYFWSFHCPKICIKVCVHYFLSNFYFSPNIIWWKIKIWQKIVDISLNIPFTETDFLNRLVFLQFEISSSEKCFFLLGTNFLASSAKLSESFMVGLSFFILITWHLTIDLTLSQIPSMIPLLWEVAENINFLLYWNRFIQKYLFLTLIRQVINQLSCINWCLNFGEGPSDQIIFVCHYS